MNRDTWNACRHEAGSPLGHYESWFQRANHPKRPLAFWIRYTIFCPRGRPDQAIGELWAMYFDGETDSLIAIKEEHPLQDCAFAKTGLQARIGQADLNAGHLDGQVRAGDHSITWELDYESPESPLLLFPPAYYGAPFPKAKALVGSPLAPYRGSLKIDDETIDIDGWVGSQNHNWGSKHTDQYAWGQVDGFDDAPEAHLEVSTGKIKLGPLETPQMTVMVLRLDGEEYRLTGMGQGLRARGSYDFFHWNFSSQRKGVEISGGISAPPESFIALPYRNPPGGKKTCLNSKLASCNLTLRRPGRPARTLSTRRRAAFEIVTDEADHGVPVLRVQDGRGVLGRGRFA